MRAIERKVYILLTKEQFNNENFKPIGGIKL